MKVSHVQLARDLPSNRTRTWDALTVEIADWWPKDMLTLGPQAKMALDPSLDGGLTEEDPDGSAVLWGRVIRVRFEHEVLMSGELGPECGPARTMIQWRLASAADAGGPGGTRLTLDEHAYGPRVPEGSEEGWTLVLDALESHLKAHPER